MPNATGGWEDSLTVQKINTPDKDPIVEFRSLQYALFLTIFIEILGSVFFFLTAIYIERDKARVDLTITGKIPLCS